MTIAEELGRIQKASELTARDRVIIAIASDTIRQYESASYSLYVAMKDLWMLDRKANETKGNGHAQVDK